MKKILLLIHSLLLFCLFFSCSIFGIQGSGIIVDNSYTFTDFTSVKASSTCDVTILQGDTYSIVVSIDDNLIPYLETYMSKNTLNINLESGNSYNKIHFKASVIIPQLSSLHMSGASEGTVSGFENKGDFTVVLSGASHGDINFISSTNISCNVSGASNLKISSADSSGNIDIDCSGASNSDLRNIEAINGNFEISGASRAYVDVSGAMTGKLSGASTLYYRGNPTGNSIKLSGASNIKLF